MMMSDWNGEKIAEPGVYTGVPLEFYHGPEITTEPSISKSGLKTIWTDGPSAYWWTSVYNPNADEDESTPALDLGRAAHHWLLGEADFATYFALRPEMAPDGRAWNGNNTSCREWLKDRADEGRPVVTVENMKTLRRMRDGLLRNSLVQQGALDGAVERSLIFRCPTTGVWMRSRPDVIPNTSGDYVDLKSCGSLSPRSLQSAIGEGQEYRMQAAVTRMACRALDLPFQSFSFAFVLTKTPFDAEVLTLKDNEIDRGERQVLAAARMFSDGMATGRWPTKREAFGGSDWIESSTWDQTRTDDLLDRLEKFTPVSEAAE